MPELPEVELTARALAQRLDGHRVTALRIYNRQLRWRIPGSLAKTIAGQRIEHVSRRGKYLLWRLQSGVLISHLGMSGSWRLHDAGHAPARQRHDHVELECAGAIARLNDPRRFGALLWHAQSAGDVLHHRLLAGLGMEPFDERFDGDWLYAATRARHSPIKQLLLAGKTVVGVGNIYAT
ncbi:MAG TPA: DNA-formamidopyrimidine glycosylase family protein, partial [Burkholderiaceae bacterium]|nr:DNA-formamidopyrimidine glycosylase family protein [Burkholderiaceae bacterium]